MSLADKAREAREHADACIDPLCHARANALEGAVDAEFDAIRKAHAGPADTSGIPTPEEAGLPARLLIAPPDFGEY